MPLLPLFEFQKGGHYYTLLQNPLKAGVFIVVMPASPSDFTQKGFVFLNCSCLLTKRDLGSNKQAHCVNVRTHDNSTHG